MAETKGISRLQLESLYRRNAITRRQFLAGLAAIGLTAGAIELLTGSAPLMDAASPTTPDYLVVMVLDAFRPDYMQLTPMPTLAALQRGGASYDRAWVGQLESETPVGHASLSTGSLPKHDGVIGFEWRDPVTREEALDGWPPDVMAGDMDRDLKASGASSIPMAIKAANPQATVVALSSEKVYAADAMGGPAADYILFHQRHGSRSPLVPSAVPGHMPPKEFFQHPHLNAQQPMRHFTDWDYLSGMLALAAIEEFQPKVLMINFPGGDVYGHPYGGPASPGIMGQVAAGVDRNIGRVIDAYKTAGIYDRTLFVVTADHGMVPNDRAVDGPTTKQAIRRAGGNYLFHTGGTAADIYLRNPWHAPAVAGAMLKVPNVTAAYHRVNHKGQHSYEAATGMKLDPSLDAAYRFLLDTFLGPTAPDVVAPFRENTIGTTDTKAHGDHGGLNWGAQHIPMVLSGPGVRSGVVSHYPARLVDLAPTVLRLMGLSLPTTDGIVLADALLSATAAEVGTQGTLAPSLTSYQDALMLQSHDNVAEDNKKHIVPPAAAPARP